MPITGPNARYRRRQATKNNSKKKTSSPYFPSVFTVIKLLLAGYTVFLVLWLQAPMVKRVVEQTTTSSVSLPSGGRNLSGLQQIMQNNNEQEKSQPKMEQLTGNNNMMGENDNFLPRILAFVFPQFHQDALNDRLWGEGFTDWDNLRKAPTKNRLGYDIPRPTELGYYNLTDTEPRKQQGELARQYGIDGFIYHHYWFYDPKHPGPSLHAPLMSMLHDGHPDLPFALHWCASKWTNTWNGKVRPDFVFDDPGVLQKQYFPSDNDTAIVEHYQWLRQFFHHPNYIKVDGGKPLFMMYNKKPGSFAVLDRFQELAKADGFSNGLYLTVGLTMPHEHLLELDTATTKRSDYTNPGPQTFSQILRKRFDRPLAYPNPAPWNTNRTLEVPSWCLDDTQLNHARVKDIVGIISSFDNSPRRSFEEAHIETPGPPHVIVERFHTNLQAALYYEACCFPDEQQQRQHHDRNDDDRFIVINAMNEWAEGMALEPSDTYGRTFLEAIQTSKQRVRGSQCRANEYLALVSATASMAVKA